MMQFKVHFHRYANGRSRLSAAEFLQAETFWDATKQAELMKQAMASVDLESSFIIASISTEGLRGEGCVSGWETAEEMTARVTAKAEAK